MTWKSHCLANVVLAAVLTHSPAATAAAMLTATLPDQLEVFLPLGRHRGATHWLAVWLVALLVTPFYVREHLSGHFLLPGFGQQAWHLDPHFAGTCLFGLALGPFLHVLLDGCSDSGVPFAPFSRWKLCLGMYRTYSHRWRWDLSELLFLTILFACSAAVWWIRNGSHSVY